MHYLSAKIAKFPSETVLSTNEICVIGRRILCFDRVSIAIDNGPPCVEFFGQNVVLIAALPQYSFSKLATSSASDHQCLVI
jgi:hypothetical protein